MVLSNGQVYQKGTLTLHIVFTDYLIDSELCAISKGHLS